MNKYLFDDLGPTFAWEYHYPSFNALPQPHFSHLSSALALEPEQRWQPSKHLETDSRLQGKVAMRTTSQSGHRHPDICVGCQGCLSLQRCATLLWDIFVNVTSVFHWNTFPVWPTFQGLPSSVPWKALWAVTTRRPSWKQGKRVCLQFWKNTCWPSSASEHWLAPTFIKASKDWSPTYVDSINEEQRCFIKPCYWRSEGKGK